MEELIKQAFLHVEVVGPQVQEGHYDLIAPDGEIILPTVWEKVVQPDWSITMHMWPMERMPRPGMPPGMMPGQGGPRPGHPHREGGGHDPRRPHFPPGAMFPGMPRPAGFPAGGGRGGNPMVPPPPPGGGGGGGGWPLPRRPAAEVIEVAPGKAPKRVSKTGGTSVLGWMAGSKPKSKDKDKKYVGTPAPSTSQPRSFFTLPFLRRAPHKSVPFSHSPSLPHLQFSNMYVML